MYIQQPIYKSKSKKKKMISHVRWGPINSHIGFYKVKKNYHAIRGIHGTIGDNIQRTSDKKNSEPF